MALVASRDGPPFRAAFESTRAAVGPDDELIVVDTAETGLAGIVGARVVRAPGAGRREALATAARASSHDVVVALAAHARPRPGFTHPLVAAVAEGAVLAAPIVESAAGPVWGYRRDPDGSLLPRRHAHDGPLDVLALDCLAAPRAFFVDRMPPFDVSESLYETLVASAAGRLAVAADAVVERTAAGPNATVVVCTHDRADEVGPCLDALAAQGAHLAGDEVIVVANACTDDTAALVEARAAALGGAIRLVEEPVTGLSRARNAAAGVAANELLLFIDDDVRPAPGWLEAVRDAFCDPAVSFVGGPIAALWPEGRPAGFPGPRLQAFYSVLDRGDTDATSEPGDIYGANFAVRADVLAECGHFDPSWGYVGGSAVVAEDTELCTRAARLGRGLTAYVAAAAVGHRIDPPRLDEAWLARRVFRHGLAIPHLRAAFLEPEPDALTRLAADAAAEFHSKVPLAGTLSVGEALAAIHNDARPLEERMDAARCLGTIARAVTLLGSESCRLGELELRIAPEEAAGLVELPTRPEAWRRPRILAIVPAHNEADVIEHTVGDLIANGIEVYLLDNRSTDGTADRVRHLLGHGLVHIERFPDDCGYPLRDEFVLCDQLRRFAEIAAEQDADWTLIADADEFRESPFPGTTLAEAIELADRLDYNAIDFALFNFRPADDSFVPGSDVRLALTAYESSEPFDAGQIKTWKNVAGVDLSDLFGVGAQLPGRRVFPIRFILRHYPIRGEEHGRRKVLRERLGRFATEERANGWHVQYDPFASGERSFLWDPATLTEWDGDAIRLGLLGEGVRDLLTALFLRNLDPVTAPIHVRELTRRLAAAGGAAGGVDAALEAARTLAERWPLDGERLLERVDPRTLPGLAETCDLLRGEAGIAGDPVRRRRFADIRDAVAERLSPGVEIPGLAVVAFADDLLAAPELLARYCDAFAPTDPVTLAVLTEDDEIERLAALVPDPSPDILAVPRSFGLRWAPGHAAALLGPASRPGLERLPRFDDTDLTGLRRHLDLPVERAA